MRRVRRPRHLPSRAVAIAVAATLAVGLAACSASSSATDAASSGGTDYGTLTAGTLKIGTLSDAKPYAYTENGTLKGFEVDMATAIAAHMKLKPVFIQQEFSTLLPAVAAGSLDVAAASTSVTAERKKSVDFSDTYFIGYISILTDDASITKKTSSLAGKRIGLMQGTLEDQYAQDHFPKDISIVRYPDNNSAKSAMKAGSIDAVFLDAPVGQAYVKADPSLEIPIDIALPDYPVAMSMHKDKPALRKGINKAIKEIIASGEWLEIEKKYYGDQPVDPMFEPSK